MKWNLWDRQLVLNAAIRPLAKTDVYSWRVAGMADGTKFETTVRYLRCGHVTCSVRLEDTRGQRHAVAVRVYGWKVLLLIDAIIKILLAVTAGQTRAHEALWARALITQALMNRAGVARLLKVDIDQGFWDGPTQWWLGQQVIDVMVPANTTMTLTTDARAQAAAGEALTVGCRVHTIRHGQAVSVACERRGDHGLAALASPTLGADA